MIVAYGKHGTDLYESALKLLEERITEGYWYDNWNDGNPMHQWKDRADDALKRQDENIAYRFLTARQEFEYEGFEIQEPRG